MNLKKKKRVVFSAGSTETSHLRAHLQHNSNTLTKMMIHLKSFCISLSFGRYSWNCDFIVMVNTIKGSISDGQFQSSLFFSNLQIFLNIQRERHCNELTHSTTALSETVYFRKSVRHFFCCWDLIFRRQKLIQASVSSKNHLNLDFVKFLCIVFQLRQQCLL